MEHLNTLEPSSSAIKRPPRTLQGGDEEMVEPGHCHFKRLQMPQRSGDIRYCGRLLKAVMTLIWRRQWKRTWV